MGCGGSAAKKAPAGGGCVLKVDLPSIGAGEFHFPEDKEELLGDFQRTVDVTKNSGGSDETVMKTLVWLLTCDTAIENKGSPLHPVYQDPKTVNSLLCLYIVSWCKNESGPKTESQINMSGAIGKSGAVKVLVQMIESGQVDRQQSASRALEAIVISSLEAKQAFEDGVIEALVTFSESNMNSLISGVACNLISTIAEADATYKDTIIEQGCLKIFVADLGLAAADDNAVRRLTAVRNLENMLRDESLEKLGKQTATAIELGVVEELDKFKDSTDEEMQACHSALMAALDDFKAAAGKSAETASKGDDKKSTAKAKAKTKGKAKAKAKK